MKNAIILHGMPSEEEYASHEGQYPSKMHWLPWLKTELEKRGIKTETPELPRPYAPVYGDWKAVFESLSFNEETTLIGHSCGAGFLVRWLSEHKQKVGKVALVAPWLDPTHELKNNFFDFVVDSGLITKTDGISIFVSRDDDQEILDSVARLKEDIPAIAVKEFQNRGHFTLEDMGTREFPELLEILV